MEFFFTPEIRLQKVLFGFAKEKFAIEDFIFYFVSNRINPLFYFVPLGFQSVVLILLLFGSRLDQPTILILHRHHLVF